MNTVAEKQGYKKTELGLIPENWNVKYLEEVVDFTNGKAHEQSIVEDEGFIVVNSKFVSTEGKVYKFSSENISPLFKNDITFVMSDIPNGKAIAKCFLVDQDNKYTLNQRICSLKAKNDNDSKYLFYTINRNQYFLAFDNGVSQTNLRKDEVLKCPLKMPPLLEQQKIAEILSTVDEKIDHIDKQIEQAEQLKKGLMQELLTKGIGHTEFKDSVIGRIPQAWGVQSLEHVSERIIVGLATSTTKYYREQGIPLIRNLNIKNGKLDNTDMLYLCPKFCEANKSKMLKENDVIIVRTGYAGLSCLVPQKYAGAQSFTTLIVTTDKHRLEPLYLVYHLNSNLGQAEVSRLQFGGNRNNLNAGEIVNYKIAVPSSIEEQQKITEILSTADEKLETLQNKKSEYENLKKALMQKLLTGQIRVRV